MGLRTALGLKMPKLLPCAKEPSESKACFRVAEEHAEKRRAFLKRVPKGKVGAELGVFTGAFSKVLFEETRPQKFYLVDVWHTKFGDLFPWSSPFTEFGTLTTHEALSRVRSTVASLKGDVEIVISDSCRWLDSQPDASLDWVYIDTTHTYDDTIKELNAAARVVKPSGLILGDDAAASPTSKHHGNFLALRDFTRQGAFEITYLDDYCQWSARRSA